MSSNDDMPPPKPKDFAALIGQVTIAYNRVQWCWLMLFGCYLLGDKLLAKAIFESLRNDASQRDVIIAAGTVALVNEPKVLASTRALMDLTNKLSAERNAAIHTFWDTELISGKFIPTPGLKKHGKLEADTVAQFERVLDDLDGLYSDLLVLTSLTIVCLASDDRYLEPQFSPSASE